MSRVPAVLVIATLMLAIALAPYAFQAVATWRARRRSDG
jgi:hypothetical protein